jgi:galactokinase
MTVRYRAPGRVNLMGDHTDYNEGFVLPMAIQLECVVDAGPSSEPVVRARSREEAGEVEIAADGTTDPAAVTPAWGRYIAGVVRALAGRGRAPVGLELAIASTVPVGSGLSSSAATEVSCALALCDAGDLELSPTELAKACQEAEQLATGVPSGIMDQLSSIGGREGQAVMIDCRSLDLAYFAVPEELGIVVVHSGVPRTLEGSAYAERRAACEQIAAALGVPALRDAREEDVRDKPLARHVVSENARVHALAHALDARDGAEAGRLFDESHASLRDDYRVSTPELDALVDRLVGAGAYGARLTGAGFGGCAVGVAAAADAGRIVAELRADYPQAWVVRAADGAGPAA